MGGPLSFLKAMLFNLSEEWIGDGRRKMERTGGGKRVGTVIGTNDRKDSFCK